VLGFYLIEKTGLMAGLKLPPARVARFLRVVEANYFGNPYHNKTHAADVVQTMHVVLLKSGMAGSAYADPVTHLGCLLAAAVHDLQHAGLTK
jgi:hypothetical protein